MLFMSSVLMFLTDVQSLLCFSLYPWTCLWFSTSSHHVLRMKQFPVSDCSFLESFGTEYHIDWMRIMMMTKLVVEQIDLWTNSTVSWHSTGGGNPSHISLIFHCWVFDIFAFHFCWCELINPVSKTTDFVWFNIHKLSPLIQSITHHIDPNELLSWCCSIFNLFLFLNDDISNKLVVIFPYNKQKIHVSYINLPSPASNAQQQMSYGLNVNLSFCF